MSLSQFETDEQRAEALIDWLKENSKFIVGLIGLSVALFFGTHFYKSSQAAGVKRSSDQYGLFKDLYQQDSLNDEAFEAVKGAKHTIYGTFAASLLASDIEQEKRDGDAVALLEEAIKREKDTVLKAMLTYRLALAHYNSDQFDEAQKVLEKITLASYEPLVKTLAGDIALKRGDHETARIRYSEALEMNDENQLSLTYYKLQALGGAL